MGRFVTFISKQLIKIGLEVKFVRPTTDVSAVSINTFESVNNSWSKESVRKAFMSKEISEFIEGIKNILLAEHIVFENGKVADVGCGIGFLLHQLTAGMKMNKIDGYEFSTVAIQHGEQLFPEITFVPHDIYQPIQSDYDLVLCTEVIEHLLFPDKALLNLAGMIKTGHLFITVPDGRKDTFNGHINFWSPESWDVFIHSVLPDSKHIKLGRIGTKYLYALILISNQ